MKYQCMYCGDDKESSSIRLCPVRKGNKHCVNRLQPNIVVRHPDSPDFLVPQLKINRNGRMMTIKGTKPVFPLELVGDCFIVVNAKKYQELVEEYRFLKSLIYCA